MAFDISNTLDALRSHLRATKYVDNAVITEPTQPPPRRTAAVYLADWKVNYPYVGSDTHETYTVVIRLYSEAFTDLVTGEADEKQMQAAAEQVLSDIFTDYDLGGTIREVDIGGMNGEKPSISWGYVDISGKMQRICDIRLPMNIDGSITVSA